MRRLFLKFVDPEGRDQLVEVPEGDFVIGRHSACDLVISDSRLSREHLQIDHSDEFTTVTDLGSSNGTTLNGSQIRSETELTVDGALDLGGGVLIEFYFEDSEQESDAAEFSAQEVAAAPEGAETQTPAEAANGFGAALVVLPLLGLFLILAVGIGALFYLNRPNQDEGQRDRERSRNERDFDRDFDDSPYPTIEETPASTTTPVITGSPAATPISTLTPEIRDTRDDLSNGGGLDRKREALVYSFMRKIAKNDSRPYLTTSRFNEVSARINRFKGSSALASNIRSAVSSGAVIRSIAAAKNLQPQFLAAAAIARQGNRSGNVAAKAREMSEILDRLTIVLGNELADDAILVIAAYDEGKAGNTLRMRDRLANLTRKNPTASPREVRTVWFLREKGQISQAQYDFALDFLAVGTIAQNPKEFGVNSEAFNF
ncbi:MAG: FHA domain-containing protein [Pyrinomonadaceae bacterium]|nr:FHA domain-containing protein [Pyrinomonadaceae bacterium]